MRPNPADVRGLSADAGALARQPTDTVGKEIWTPIGPRKEKPPPASLPQK
jgi:hypothetical protein